MQNSVFKQQISAAISAHGEWRGRLRRAAMQKDTTLDVATIARDDCCAFGKWIDTWPEAFGQDPTAQDVREKHRAFHQRAGAIAEMIVSGRREAALRELSGDRFQETTKGLVRQLSRWQLAGVPKHAEEAAEVEGCRCGCVCGSQPRPEQRAPRVDLLADAKRRLQARIDAGELPVRPPRATAAPPPVGRNRVFREECAAAIAAHGEWRRRLTAAVACGDRSLDVQGIGRNDQCRFGKWLQSLDPAVRRRPQMREVDQLHTRFHKAAGGVAALIVRGESDCARAALKAPDYADVSHALIARLTRLQFNG